ncbi:hypothetical protein pb186bvf_004562 [Paramecium bursaria]
MIKRIFLIRIDQDISRRLVEQVSQALESRYFSKPTMLAIQINSQGGSIIQTKNLINILQSYCKKQEQIIINYQSIKMNTFAQDVVFQSAMLLLASGYHAYANPYTLIGNIGYSYVHGNLEQSQKKWDFEYTQYNSGKYKDQFSNFKDLDPKLANKIVTSYQNQLINLLKKSRDLREVPLGVNDTETYKQIGLIDGYKTLEEVAEGEQIKLIF